MQKWSGVIARQFAEPLGDQSHGTGLPGRNHCARWNLSQRCVLLPGQDFVQVTKGLLLRNNGDVIPPRVLHESLRILCGNGTAWKRWQRVRRILHRVLEIWRVDV